ncbi:MAG: hypothetical protein PHN72_04895 [Bacilli bacterium]|nr:hypothetical protein [Bacilli bacterium]
MSEELKKIKKLYGENFAHFCRSLFPEILEKEGTLLQLLTDHFAVSRELYHDITETKKIDKFRSYIYSFIEPKNKKEFISDKTPSELLEEAGYHLYECKSEEDIQFFKKYYEKDEELCTFKENRLLSNHVFFAVKKDVENIKRKDFLYPQRQDLYGTSVLSIQFLKGKVNMVSIKNRYNHIVDDPDATFSNDLDLIADGLANSFMREYHLNKISNTSKFTLRGYVFATDEKYYKYNEESDNVYYCPNNIIIDKFRVQKYDTSRYLIFDSYILDLQEKKIKDYKTNKDLFVESLQDIKNIKINKIGKFKEIHIQFTDSSKEEVIIKLDKLNTMISLSNPNLKTVGNYFLYKNKKIEELYLSNTEEIGDDFCYFNHHLKVLHVPKLKTVGDSFCKHNIGAKQLFFPCLVETGNDFFRDNVKSEKLVAPNLKKVGDEFYRCNQAMSELHLQSLEETGAYFLGENKKLDVLYTPNLRSVGYSFCYENIAIEKLDVSSLERAGFCFLANNLLLKEIIAPNLIIAEDGFLVKNVSLKRIQAANLRRVGDNFLKFNKGIHELYFPNLEQAGNFFFSENDRIKDIYTPGLIKVGRGFLENNNLIQDSPIPYNEEALRYYLRH